MKEVFRHPTLGDITISCTRRSTRTTISVRPSGEVRLSFPPYISKRKALAFLESKSEWVRASMAKYAERRSVPSPTKEDIERMRSEAKATLPQRVAELASRFGLKYGKVTIRAARTKWGSCTARGDISLSLYLMTLPEHLRDYIIIHELCHTVHLNHSPRFHALVNEFTEGRERELAKELPTPLIFLTSFIFPQLFLAYIV